MINSIVYYSLSGNTKSFADRFKRDGFDIIDYRDAAGINEPFVLFTPTYNFGEIPAPVDRFLSSNHENMKYVVSFGNMNWGVGYALAGVKVNQKYGVPLLLKVEMRGTNAEYEKVKEILNGGV